jgi:hypothetical protein
VADLKEESGTVAHLDASGTEYLASYASFPAKGTRWTAVVRLRRNEAMKPIRTVESWVIVSSLFSFGGSIVLLVAVWSWLIWFLRRKERRHRA